MIQKGDIVKIGVGRADVPTESNKVTPFTNKKWGRNVFARVLSVSEYRKKRKGPAFTCNIPNQWGNCLKVVGMGRTDCYQLATDSEVVMFKLEQE
jgi:predicted nucleic acid binding AN1-type Zn finger protein